MSSNNSGVGAWPEFNVRELVQLDLNGNESSGSATFPEKETETTDIPQIEDPSTRADTGTPFVAASVSHELYSQHPVPVPEPYADESSEPGDHEPQQSSPDEEATQGETSGVVTLLQQEQQYPGPEATPPQGHLPPNHNKQMHLLDPNFHNGDDQQHRHHPDQYASHVGMLPSQQQRLGELETTAKSHNTSPLARAATVSTELPASRQVRFDPNTHTPTPSASSHTRRQRRVSHRTPQPPQPVRSPMMANYRQQQTHQRQQQQKGSVYDVLIIGGGVVGLAVLRAATLQGYRCVLVEAEADLLRGASSANSGIACTGVDATIGTLERALIRDSISQIRPFLKAHRIPYRDCGSLVCQWEWDDVGRDKKYQCPLAKVLAESHDAGDSHARKLNANELGNLEPNISPLCVGAVHIPGEIVVDSWLFSISLAAHARENGAQVYTSFEFDAKNSWFDENERVWNVLRTTGNDHLTPVNPPKLLRASAIVNATGIVADLVQAATAGVNPPHWRAAPRRGQYRVFLADDCTHITRPIQPVPTQRTKGIFLYSSLYDHIVVGPTAQEQESRFDRTIDPTVADDLTSFALRIIPDLDPIKQHVGEYVGIRPATDYRDYQICMTPQRNWIVAAGIRSTGLTASLGIGRHITNLLQSILPFPSPLRSIRTSPLPTMKELVEHYNSNREGNVLIHGYLCK